MANVTFEWVLPEGKVGEARKALQKAGVETGKPTPWEPGADDPDYPDAAFEPMTILAVSLGASVLLKVLSDVILKQRYPGGELFDLRGGKVKRRPIPSLPPGTLVLVTDQGTTKFAPEKRDEGFSILAKAMGSLGGG
jgi:hypothetical protein